METSGTREGAVGRNGMLLSQYRAVSRCASDARKLDETPQALEDEGDNPEYRAKVNKAEQMRNGSQSFNETPNDHDMSTTTRIVNEERDLESPEHVKTRCLRRKKL